MCCTKFQVLIIKTNRCAMNLCLVCKYINSKVIVQVCSVRQPLYCRPINKKSFNTQLVTQNNYMHKGTLNVSKYRDLARIQPFQHVNGSNNDIFNIFIQIQTISSPSDIVHIKMQLFDQFKLFKCQRVINDIFHCSIRWMVAKGRI